VEIGKFSTSLAYIYMYIDDSNHSVILIVPRLLQDSNATMT